MRGHRVRTAAAALAAAAVLTACSGGAGGGAEAGEPGSASTPPAASTTPGGAAGGPADGAERSEEAEGDRAAAAPGTPEGDSAPTGLDRVGEPVPEEEIVAAEDREFTPEQEEFLRGQVPEGADPAAVLVAGEEACYRIGYLARHDPGAAVEALAGEEIPQAGRAVATLCPEHGDLLDQAQERS